MHRNRKGFHEFSCYPQNGRYTNLMGWEVIFLTAALVQKSGLKKRTCAWLAWCTATHQLQWLQFPKPLALPFLFVFCDALICLSTAVWMLSWAAGFPPPSVLSNLHKVSKGLRYWGLARLSHSLLSHIDGKLTQALLGLFWVFLTGVLYTIEI